MLKCAYLAQSVELSAVNRSVVGSSPTVGATFGELEKRLNSHAFHACIHGFESRIRHQCRLIGLIQNISPFFLPYPDNYSDIILLIKF